MAGALSAAGLRADVGPLEAEAHELTSHSRISHHLHVQHNQKPRPCVAARRLRSDVLSLVSVKGRA